MERTRNSDRIEKPCGTKRIHCANPHTANSRIRGVGKRSMTAHKRSSFLETSSRVCKREMMAYIVEVCLPIHLSGGVAPSLCSHAAVGKIRRAHTQLYNHHLFFVADVQYRSRKFLRNRALAVLQERREQRGCRQTRRN